MKKLLILTLFIFGFAQTGKAQLYFTFDSITNPPYICQANAFDLEVFITRSSNITIFSHENVVVSNDSIYVNLYFITGPGGTGTIAPFYRKVNVPAPLIFGQYKILALGYHNGLAHKFATSAISICSGMLNTSKPESKEPTFTVFPNPAQDLLQVSLSQNKAGCNLQLTDVSGKTVQTLLVTAGNLQPKLNLENLPAGIYFLQFTNGEENFTKKIIKR